MQVSLKRVEVFFTRKVSPSRPGLTGLFWQRSASSIYCEACKYNNLNLPFGEILSGCVMAAGAGAGSIFQGAQHEAGENSAVGPLPADINIVEPPYAAITAH